jgi:hypothetical protein
VSGPRIALPAAARRPDGSLDVYEALGADLGRGRLSGLTRKSAALDIVTRELVRLRNADLQGCHF